MTPDEFLAAAAARGLRCTLGPPPTLPDPAAAPAPDPDLDEAAFTRRVLELAAGRGWLRFHARPARTRSGWRTPVAGDGVGFPDLVLVRGGRLVVAELKAGRNAPTAAQRRWLAALAAAGAEVYVWKPRDWPAVLAALAKDDPPADRPGDARPDTVNPPEPTRPPRPRYEPRPAVRREP